MSEFEGNELAAKNYLEVEDLEVYKKLSRLHIDVFLDYRSRYKECIRTLNGLEKTLERKIPKREQRWQISEELAEFDSSENVPWWLADYRGIIFKL